MSKARIRINSTDIGKVIDICDQIKDIAEKVGVKFKGPIPLPRRSLRVPVRKSPCGSGRESYETWEMRIFKRLIDLEVDERALRLIMRVSIPKGVNIEIEIKED